MNCSRVLKHGPRHVAADDGNRQSGRRLVPCGSPCPWPPSFPAVPPLGAVPAMLLTLSRNVAGLTAIVSVFATSVFLTLRVAVPTVYPDAEAVMVTLLGVALPVSTMPSSTAIDGERPGGSVLADMHGRIP